MKVELLSFFYITMIVADLVVLVVVVKYLFLFVFKACVVFKIIIAVVIVTTLPVYPLAVIGKTEFHFSFFT